MVLLTEKVPESSIFNNISVSVNNKLQQILASPAIIQGLLDCNLFFFFIFSTTILNTNHAEGNFVVRPEFTISSLSFLDKVKINTICSTGLR